MGKRLVRILGRRKTSLWQGLVGFAGVIGMWCAMTACTEKDTLFGNELIPPGQIMGSVIDSNIMVSTYIDTYDSVQTNISGNYTPYFGTLTDPIVGRTTSQMITNYAPFGFRNDKYFGTDPVIDSMTFGFQFSSFYGDPEQVFTVDVYEISGYVFKVDSGYFSNFDITPYISSTPLFSFEQKGSEQANGHLPIEFARRHLDTTPGEENVYYTDTNFHKVFNGLYFKLRDETPAADSCMLQMDLSQSVMTLFYHNAEKDTTFQRMLFVSDYTFYNTNFMTVQHDYTDADPSVGGVQVAAIGDLENPSEYCYVQGLAGLMSKIKIDASSLERIKAETQAKGYTHVALHKAELQVTIADARWQEYLYSFSSLGMYYDMLDYKFMSEYNPILEALGSGYTSTLGGKLNRSKGVFTFDITSHLQKLITEKEERFTTELLPIFGDRNSLLRARVYGSDSPYPPLLILTYTMVK